jgi:hypothetical protein
LQRGGAFGIKAGFATPGTAIVGTGAQREIKTGWIAVRSLAGIADSNREASADWGLTRCSLLAVRSQPSVAQGGGRRTWL